MSTDTTPGGDTHAMTQRALRMAMDTITGQEDDWEEIAKAQIEAAIAHLGALEAARRDAQETANAYSAALSMVEDCLTDAVGDDTSVNDIRQSLGLPIRDDLLPPPPDGDVDKGGAA